MLLEKLEQQLRGVCLMIVMGTVNSSLLAARTALFSPPALLARKTAAFSVMHGTSSAALCLQTPPTPAVKLGALPAVLQQRRYA
jgi:hypothetical protein